MNNFFSKFLVNWLINLEFLYIFVNSFEISAEKWSSVYQDGTFLMEGIDSFFALLKLQSEEKCILMKRGDSMNKKPSFKGSTVSTKHAARIKWFIISPWITAKQTLYLNCGAVTTR